MNDHPPQPPLGATPEPSASDRELAEEILDKRGFATTLNGLSYLIAAHVAAEKAKWRAFTEERARAALARFVIDECDTAHHKFVKLDGTATRCPHCLAIGLESTRAALTQCEERLKASDEAVAYWKNQWNGQTARMDEGLTWKKFYCELIDEIYGERPDGENERPDPRQIVRGMRTRAESAEAVIKQITEGHPNAALVCELRTRAIDAEAKLAQCEEKLAKAEARANFHRDLGITLLDAKYLDPACHAGCQSLVHQQRLADHIADANKLAAAHAKALEDGNRMEAALREILLLHRAGHDTHIAKRQNYSSNFQTIKQAAEAALAASAIAASAPATTGKGGEIS